MSENHREGSVNPSNFWSFNFIDFKGLPLQFGSKTLNVLKLQILKVEVAVFYSFFVVKKRIFGEFQLSRSSISNLEIYEIE